MSRRWRVWRISLAIVAALIVPVLVLGLAFEDHVQSWVAAEWPATVRFWVIVAALAGDILLPTPSSGVSTYAGATLGVVGGTSASWLGMTIGAAIGFAAARLLGRTFAERQSSHDLQRLDNFVSSFGVIALVITRPLPLLAEACVLLLGTSPMPWRRFMPVVAMTNLVISLAYAICGAYFRDRGVLPQALIASVIVPMAMTLLARRAWLSRSPNRDANLASTEERRSDREIDLDAHRNG